MQTANTLPGYYAYMNWQGGAGVGAASYGWANLAYATIPGGISLNKQYRFRVIVSGTNIRVYVTDMVNAVINFQDSRYSSGQSGVRAFYVQSSWANFTQTLL